MHSLRRVAIGAVLALVAAGVSHAEPASDGNNSIAPLPEVAAEQPADRIAPEGSAEQRVRMLSTQEPIAPLPWKKTDTSPAITTKTQNPLTARGAPVPFGRSEAPAREVPSGPHTTTAVPVTDVDTIEASEPAPPTPVEPEADPANEDPTVPTEDSSPIFDPASGGAPRKILLRALNKVTAQSVRFEVKPGETVSFGQLEITPVTCRTSTPTSQRDDAGLMEITERLPGTPSTIKPIFRGWMYASSPSVSALEHPIYDVTMVMCDTSIAVATKPSVKDGKKKR